MSGQTADIPRFLPDTWNWYRLSWSLAVSRFLNPNRTLENSRSFPIRKRDPPKLVNQTVWPKGTSGKSCLWTSSEGFSEGQFRLQVSGDNSTPTDPLSIGSIRARAGEAVPWLSSNPCCWFPKICHALVDDTYDVCRSLCSGKAY